MRNVIDFARASRWLLLAVTLGAAPAHAGIGVHLVEPVVRVARGANLAVPVRLVNGSDQLLFLRGVGHDLPESLMPPGGFDEFIATRPDSIHYGTVWDGVLLNLHAAPDAPIGPEIYQITLLGGPGHENNDVIGQALIQVDVYDATCMPVIVTQPGSLHAASGSNAALTVAISDASGVQYQWRREGLPLFEDPHITGVQTASLAFTGITAADSGAYDVLITSACGEVTSVAVGVQVSPSAVGVPATPLRPALFLAPPRPNPMRHSVTFAWSLPVAGPVLLDVLDVAGRHVRNLVEGPREAGVGQALWDGATRSGSRAAAGVYFVRLTANRETRIQKLVVLQ
jgi:hypothetical protein